MVFLRPVVLRDDASAEVLSSGRYQGMQNLQTESARAPTSTLPVSNDQVLPDFPVKESTASPAAPTDIQPSVVVTPLPAVK
jgi:general secretion pathway protein D